MTGLIEMSINAWNKYFGTSAVRWLFVAALAGLIAVALRSGKSEEKKTARFLLCFVLILLAVIFCPVSAWAITKLVGSGVYWRTLWIVPVVPVLAWGTVKLISIGKKTVIRVLAGGICLAAVAGLGSTVFSEQYFTKRENNFKVETDVVQIVDQINEHAQANGVETKKLLSPYSLSTYVRIYDAGILQHYGRNKTQNEKKHKWLFREVNKKEDAHEYKKLCRRSRKKNCNYIALHAANDDPSQMEKYGWTLIGGNERYNLYFDTRYSEKE